MSTVQARLVILRRARQDDLPLLRRVYASTRQEELAAVDWDEAQRAWFLDMQFDLQARAYAQAYPEAEWQVVVCDGQPAGRLITDHTSDPIRLIDITLLPDYRSAGIGSELVHRLLDEAAAAGRPVVLHVVKSNRARALYQRLGFAVTTRDDVYLEMQWRPGGGAATQPVLSAEHLAASSSAICGAPTNQ
jgi:ribosomal protein S18 acetylase RimI-like enzyme